ncbi:MAG: DUF4368 domain-containing protein, partial [Clostridia bacterium]|nr:DUF4368 domain-containing protein [Clostridia bacterium]
AEGTLSDERLFAMVNELDREAQALGEKLEKLNSVDHEKEIRNNFAKFYSMAKDYSHIEELTRDILTTFVERIEVDAKVLPEGVKMVTHDTQVFEQEITIYFKFVSNIDIEDALAS